MRTCFAIPSRDAVVIVGMDRCATSALTELVETLAEAPRTVWRDRDFAQRSRAESEEITRLHDAMLLSLGLSLDHAVAIDPAWFLSASATTFRSSLANVLGGSMPGRIVFAVDDPRLALFVPLWTAAFAELGLEARYIIPFRDPAAVAASWPQAAQRSAPDGSWRMDRAMLVWLRFMIAVERATRQLRRCMVDVDALSANWRVEAECIWQQIGLEPSEPTHSTTRKLDALFQDRHSHEDLAANEAARRCFPAVFSDVLVQLRACMASPHDGAEAFDRIAASLDHGAGQWERTPDADRLAGKVPPSEIVARLNLLEGVAAKRAVEAADRAEAARGRLRPTQASSNRAAEAVRVAAAAAESSLRRQVDQALSFVQPRQTTRRPGGWEVFRSIPAAIVRAILPNRRRKAPPGAPPDRTDPESRLESLRAAHLETDRQVMNAWAARLEVERLCHALQIDLAVAEAGLRSAQAELARIAALVSPIQESATVPLSKAEVRKINDEVARSETVRIAIDAFRRRKRAEATAQTIQSEASRLARLRASISAPPLSEPTDDARASEPRTYQAWIERYDTITEADRALIQEQLDRLAARQMFSIVIVIDSGPIDAIRESIASVQAQLYAPWELCLVDNAAPDPAAGSLVRQLERDEPRIRALCRAGPESVGQCATAALNAAQGEFVLLLTPGTLLRETALCEVAVQLARTPGLDVVYGDEDHIDAAGQRHTPGFKSAWNPELFLASNYVGSAVFVRRSLARAQGGFRTGLDDAMVYDLLLRLSRVIGVDRLGHIPVVLTHRRAQVGEVAIGEPWLERAAQAERQALAEHLQALGEPASIEPHAVSSSWHRVRRMLPVDPPLVTIIVPTRDKPDLISRCIDGVLARTDYPAYEVLIIDHQTTDPVALAFLRSYQADSRVRIIPYTEPFNYSAMNNMAVRHARGAFVVLLNNDTDIIGSDWLSELMSLALLPGTGAVGAKLLYPDGRVQHSGVLLGTWGVAGHLFHLADPDDPGYMGRNVLPATLSAVTGACLMVRKAIFDEVGGLNADELTVDYNDVDFCLRVRERGYRNIWTPCAQLYHHESASRSPDVERIGREKQYILDRWGPLIENDPAYNPNLALSGPNFSLAFPPRRRKTWDLQTQAPTPEP